jgi:hypothetical protein
MQKKTRKLIWRIFWILIGLFIALFLFRILYGYTIKPEESTYSTHFFDELNNSKRNYASKEYDFKGENPNSGSNNKMDQKYEKIAEIHAKSSAFDAEELLIREHIGKYNGLIQFEQKTGNKGRRALHLIVGVPPEQFDSLYDQLIVIGKTLSKQITKHDKTNEYKELNANKLSLEKVLTSMVELKSKGGKIQEYIELENRILELEQELQELGVNLGDFDEVNEFCTVKMSLLERTELNISFAHRVLVAIQWSVRIYLNFVLILFFASLSAWLIALLLGKLNLRERFKDL